MIDGIFKRLTPQNAEALRKTTSENLTATSEIDVEELKTALASVTSDLEIAHSSLQKLYEEANYVYSRLTHMEQSILAKATKEKDEDEASGSSGTEVVKHLFVDGENTKTNDKLSKIQQAKALTQGLLQSIEALSEKAKKTSASHLSNAARLTMK